MSEAVPEITRDPNGYPDIAVTTCDIRP